MSMVGPIQAGRRHGPHPSPLPLETGPCWPHQTAVVMGPASWFINPNRALRAREGQTTKVPSQVRHGSYCSCSSGPVRPKGMPRPGAGPARGTPLPPLQRFSFCHNRK